MAGVSIYLISGSNGVITKATNALYVNELASLKESLELSKVEILIEMDLLDTINGEEIYKYVIGKIEESEDGTYSTNSGTYSTKIGELIYTDQLTGVKATLKIDENKDLVVKEIIKIVAHHHTEECYSTECTGEFTYTKTKEIYTTCGHKHTGNENVQGGCYTKQVTKVKPCGGYLDYYYGTIYGKCSNCSGTGQVPCTNRDNFTYSNENLSWATCPNCKKTGNYYSRIAHCPTCVRSTSQWHCTSCGYFDGGDESMHGKMTCPVCNGHACYKCENCVNVWNSYPGYPYCQLEISGYVYELNCGKEEIELKYERNVRNYKCEGCEATFVYKEPATSGVCGYCSQEHNVSEEGIAIGEHNSVERHLICGKEETF